MNKVLPFLILAALAGCSGPGFRPPLPPREPALPLLVEEDLFPIFPGASWTYRKYGCHTSCLEEDLYECRELTTTVMGSCKVYWLGAPIAAYELKTLERDEVVDVEYAVVEQDRILILRKHWREEDLELDRVLPRHRRALAEFNYGPHPGSDERVRRVGKAVEVDFRGPFGTDKAVHVMCSTDAYCLHDSLGVLLVPGVGPVLVREECNLRHSTSCSKAELVGFDLSPRDR